MYKKFFRIAKAGRTIDGREITAEQLSQVAETYDPKVYGARIWIEHVRSYLPDGEFKALGDVEEVKTETNKEGTFLLARLKPTADFFKLNQARQKIYSSIEMITNFANSGKAYLVGLAVTDSPASLGTEMLQFSRTQEKNLFSDFFNTDLSFAELPKKAEAEDETKQNFFTRFFNLKTQETTKNNGDDKMQKQEQKQEKQEQKAAEQSLQTQEFKDEDKNKILNDALAALKQMQEEFSKALADLKEAKEKNAELFNQLKTTDDAQARELATGEQSEHLTDC